jgi:hypothetical protein
MDTLTFLNSPLLWGLTAASIPVLIHLLYRRQYRRVDWAPMRYLKLSVQRNRQRIRIEQLLLLLMRTLVVLLLFFLVARPVMHAEGISRLLGGSSRVNRIVLLDDSLSMGFAEEGKTALARGQELLVDLLATFGPKDRFTLVLASQPKQPLVREIELDDLDQTVQAVRGVERSEVFSAWEPILQAIDALLASGSYPLHEVTLITDLRKAGWEGQLGDLATRWASEHVRLRVFDVGIRQTANVALLSLEQLDRLALAGTTTRCEAQVRNDSGGELAGLEANFIVDGKPSLVRLPTLTAGETAKVPFVATFQEAGAHHVGFELPNDALLGDNARSAVVEVQQSMDMLLVDGEPSSDPLGGETDFLALALSLGGDAAEAFRVEVMTDSEWASTPLTRPDLLVLANVAHLSADQVDALQRLVDSGTGLMVFVGDQVDPDNYNQLLFKGGSGLLPAALESISDSESSGVLVESAEGSPLEALGQLSPAALQRFKVHKVYEVRMSPGEVEGVRVLARWNNTAAAPAIVQKVVGSGQVLLWTTAADRSWSDWPTDSSYVLAVREAARAIARSSASLHRFTAGDPLRVDLPRTHQITEPRIEVPGGKEPKPLVLVGAELPAATDPAAKPKPDHALTYADTRRAGLYTMSWRDSVSGAMTELFAVNPDRRESELARFSPEEFKQLWGALEPEVISAGSGGDTSLVVRGQEIWRTLATGLLGLLIAEACFARWAGRQR